VGFECSVMKHLLYVEQFYHLLAFIPVYNDENTACKDPSH
jgi:hypothetical protein